MKEFIVLKKECNVIVTESDLTAALIALDDIGCGKVGVRNHWRTQLSENSTWCVSFRATLEEWEYAYREVQKACKKEVLVPLKDNFGNITYHEV